jgi:hypothetical protein
VNGRISLSWADDGDAATTARPTVSATTNRVSDRIAGS